MDRTSKEYAVMRDKPLQQLRSGESMTGKDGAFGAVTQYFTIEFPNAKIR